MSDMTETEQAVYEFVHSAEQLTATLEYWLERGKREHEELMKQLDDIRSGRNDL